MVCWHQIPDFLMPEIDCTCATSARACRVLRLRTATFSPVLPQVLLAIVVGYFNHKHLDNLVGDGSIMDTHVGNATALQSSIGRLREASPQGFTTGRCQQAPYPNIGHLINSVVSKGPIPAEVCDAGSPHDGAPYMIPFAVAHRWRLTRAASSGTSSKTRRVGG